jgi:hypothetical protein
VAERDNAGVLQQAIEDWNRGDLDAYMRLYTDDVVVHGLAPGIEAVRRMYRGVWRAYPGSTLQLDDVIVQGERLACRYTWSAVDRTSGQPFSVPGVTIMHFRDAKVAERWDFEGSEKNVA